METPEYAFMSAVHAGDLEKVRSLVERNPRLVEAQSSSDTALGSAAMGRRVAIVRYLLDNGADATRRPFEGAETPLASACFATRDQDEILEVVLLLLERGADASLPGRDGVTPLMIASWGGYARVVEALLVHGCGNVDQQHSEVDSDGRQNTTALLRAFCDDEYVGVARLLLRAGADPTIADGEGETFVAIASREGYDDSRALYQEWLVAYHLAKARRLRDSTLRMAQQQLQQLHQHQHQPGAQLLLPGGGVEAPAYLAQRMLPEVEVRWQEPSSRRVTRRGRGEAGVREQVARHLVVGFSNELFREWLWVLGP